MKEPLKMAVAFFVLGFCFGILFWALISMNGFEKESVAHHAAHYDSQTGKWQWNDEVRP